MLGVPAVVGGIPVLLKLAPALVLFGVAVGFAVGFTVEESNAGTFAQAVAAGGAIAAVGGFVLRQWMRYDRTLLRQQSQINETVSLSTVGANAGIFEGLVGAAEEQECKEAFLAYFFLLGGAAATTAAELDRRIEEWLRTTFGLAIDFEVSDALAKLDRLGLLRRDGERLAVPPPDQGLSVLERHWRELLPSPGAPR